MYCVLYLTHTFLTTVKSKRIRNKNITIIIHLIPRKCFVTKVFTIYLRSHLKHKFRQVENVRVCITHKAKENVPSTPTNNRKLLKNGECTWRRLYLRIRYHVMTASLLALPLDFIGRHYHYAHYTDVRSAYQ